MGCCGDLTYVLYFIASLALRLLVDLPLIAPDALIQQYDIRPPQITALATKWLQVNEPMFLDPPQWLRAAIIMEIVVQIPYLLLAVYAFLLQRQWIRVPTIIANTQLLTVLYLYAMFKINASADLKKLLVSCIAYGFFPCLLLLRAVFSSRMFGPSRKMVMKKDL